MRKIKSQKQVEREHRRNQIIISLVMIGILALSSLGFSLMSRDSDSSSFIEENGLDFYFENGLWNVLISDVVFKFQYLPSEVNSVYVNGSLNMNSYVNQPLYFVGNSGGIPEILNNLDPYLLRYQNACVSNETCEGDLPVKSCNESNVIIFEDSDQNYIESVGKCVYIYGDSVKGADAFLYKALGIN